MTTPAPIPGRRIRLPKWIHGRMPGGCVVRVEAEAVIPDVDPSDPCLEPNTLRWLDTLQDLADAGDVDALAKHGDVFVGRSA